MITHTPVSAVDALVRSRVTPSQKNLPHRLSSGARGAHPVAHCSIRRLDILNMRSSKSRSRSKSNRSNNNNRSTVGNIVNRVFDSSGPEGKVRGTPQQIIEKYNQLARDAQLGNDRVAAENFQQHAEHYLRMLSSAQKEMDARREEQERQNRERQAERDRERGPRNDRDGNDNAQSDSTPDHPRSRATNSPVRSSLVRSSPGTSSRAPKAARATMSSNCAAMTATAVWWKRPKASRRWWSKSPSACASPALRPPKRNPPRPSPRPRVQTRARNPTTPQPRRRPATTLRSDLQRVKDNAPSSGAQRDAHPCVARMLQGSMR